MNLAANLIHTMDFASLENRALALLSEPLSLSLETLTGRLQTSSPNVVDSSSTGIPHLARLNKLKQSALTSSTATYSPNKAGLLSLQTTNVRLQRSVALSRALMVATRNGDVASATLIRGQMAEASRLALQEIAAVMQNSRRRSTAHGDHTARPRGGRL